jgi:hypothetical protein
MITRANMISVVGAGQSYGIRHPEVAAKRPSKDATVNRGVRGTQGRTSG